MTRTTIEWTDETWNPVTGCTKVSPGCDNCYAETIAERFRGQKAFPHGFDVTLRPDKLSAPLGWRKPRRVFVNSMSDLFHDSVPDEFIAEVFAMMARTPQHTYQILTKRHGRMRAFLRRVARCEHGWLTHDGTNPVRAYDGTGVVIPTDTWPLPNVWLGVSVEDQKRANLRVPALLDTPAAVRFLSCEPLLGPVNLDPWRNPSEPPNPRTPADTRLGWVIVGGESGPGARPMEAEWAQSLRDQCSAAGVPFFFKQWGAHGQDGVRRPKHHNGRLLDGQLHDAMPEVVA